MKAVELCPNEITFLLHKWISNEGGRLEEFSRYEVTAEGYENSLWTTTGQLIPEVVMFLGQWKNY
jgi:hypothetical protein